MFLFISHQLHKIRLQKKKCQKHIVQIERSSSILLVNLFCTNMFLSAICVALTSTFHFHVSLLIATARKVFFTSGISDHKTSSYRAESGGPLFYTGPIPRNMI